MQTVIGIPEEQRDGIIGDATRNALCESKPESGGRFTAELRDVLIDQYSRAFGEVTDCQEDELAE